MSQTLFRSTSFSLRHLTENIGRGDIALPELQRPFVWSNTKVRDLFDSMYRGFPVGYLRFWETGADLASRQIGTDAKDSRIARWLIVDGQQRLTSLYSVMTGHSVVREDYTESPVKLTFRPRDGHFSVWDVAIGNDPEFLQDVSSLWRNFRATTGKFFDRYENARGKLDPDVRRDWEDAFDRVRDLQNYPFNVVELDADVDEEQVAEIFVRINSEGVKLNQADFILTLMSVFWDDGRKQLEDFSRRCKSPSVSDASPFNWYIAPQPDQLLRVTIAYAFRRARLRHAYSLLRGKDLDTGRTSEDRRSEQFDRLREAQAQVLDLTNWHEYLRCLERAGFRGAKMIAAQNAVLYTYAIWLIGREEFSVPIDHLREAVARWFFMAHTTYRYSGSFESQAERDLRQIGDLAQDVGFVAALNSIVNDTMTNDFWAITLPNELATSAARSPALFAYYAALNILDADALLSTGKVRERLDPALLTRKSVERHHLFPKAYLRDVKGIRDNRMINQIANMALVEWNDNIAISDHAPDVYWPAQVASKQHLHPERLARQIDHHALPEGWTTMEFPEFLSQRRRLIASVIQQAFERLSRPSYSPSYPSVHQDALTDKVTSSREGVVDVKVLDLVSVGLLEPGDVLTPTHDRVDASAEIDDEGNLVLSDRVFTSLSSAATEANDGTSTNGWTFWKVESPQGVRLLDDIREQFRLGNLDTDDEQIT